MGFVVLDVEKQLCHLRGSADAPDGHKRELGLGPHTPHSAMGWRPAQHAANKRSRQEDGIVVDVDGSTASSANSARIVKGQKGTLNLKKKKNRKRKTQHPTQ